MVLAEAGIPVGFLAMPTLGTTAPATLAGALAMGDAEIISAAVLMQMVAPGAPVFHSLMQAWADPSSGSYVSYPLDARGRYAPVEMAHHWGMPALGACYGTDSPEAGTWQAAAEPAMDPYMVGSERRGDRYRDGSEPYLYPALPRAAAHGCRYLPAGAPLPDGHGDQPGDPGAGYHPCGWPGRAFPGPKTHPPAHAGCHEARASRTRLARMGNTRMPASSPSKRPAGSWRTTIRNRWKPAKQAELARILAAADKELG